MKVLFEIDSFRITENSDLRSTQLRKSFKALLFSNQRARLLNLCSG